MVQAKLNAKGNFTVILGDRSNYYSQRNNEIDAHNACATTNMCQALELIYPTIIPHKKGKYKQVEDNLLHFIRTDVRVLNKYKELNISEYTKWIQNQSGAIPPNEFHAVLSYGTNLFMGKDVTRFNDNFPIDKLVYEIVVRNKPVVMSGKFDSLNHIITLAGVEIKGESFSFKPQDTWGFFDVENFIFWDTYGKTYEYKSGKSGFNVLISPSQLIRDFKSLSNPLYKWCHIFY